MNKKKITALFEYRLIPELMAFVPKEGRKSLLKSLMNLQSAIYRLDSYLESKWKLKDENLEVFWDEIYRIIMGMNFTMEEAQKMTSSIRRYQLHEQQLRANKLPTRLDPEYYYYYKSCDVRLMRHIILSKAETEIKGLNVSNWRYYDLITEINDDIEDIFEDLDVINGNMFLVKIYQDGLKEAVSYFDDLLDEILVKSVERAHKKDSERIKEIKSQTFKRYVETKQLLLSQRKAIKKKGLNKKSPIIKRLNKMNPASTSDE